LTVRVWGAEDDGHNRVPAGQKSDVGEVGIDEREVSTKEDAAKLETV
jgi:hypothetical protein